jgi:sucrose-6-phosphate hydrolase SacC (GH32 family)
VVLVWRKFLLPPFLNLFALVMCKKKSMKVKLHYQKYFFFIMMFVSTETLCQTTPKKKDEVYRPTIHFSPKTNWTNDPNGMVYHNGVYHLFYQHHPFSSVWGPMHWGHATTKDLINWKHEPIAIYPDSIGTIFSGSVVFDKTNTSGLGKNGQAPLVAIFTQHNIDGEKAGKNNFQTQSIAFSNDNGSTWEKYEGNPVLHNPGIVAFRDPKVMYNVIIHKRPHYILFFQKFKELGKRKRFWRYNWCSWWCMGVPRFNYIR